MARFNVADAVVLIAALALIVLAFRQVTVDLSSFGMGIATILGGRGVHAAGDGWGKGQQQ